MSESAFIAILAVCAFLPIIAFSAITVFRTDPEAAGVDGRSIGVDAYFLAGKSVKQSDFVDSSVGYMLQVSTTYYFIYWGYNFGFSNLFYLFTWAIGIILFSRFAVPLYESTRRFSSIPEMIGSELGGSIKVLAGLASIIAFLGVIYVEAHISADLVDRLMVAPDGDARFGSQFWLIFTVLLLGVVSYSSMGGLRKVIETDVWQLSAAYLGIAAVLSFLIAKTFSQSAITGVVLSLLSISIFLILWLRDQSHRDLAIKRYALLICILLIAAATAMGLREANWDQSSIQIEPLFKQVNSEYGWVTLFGFTVLNGLWQFCDNTNFQRIASYEFPDDVSEDERRSILRRGLRSLILVSPLTWGLGILLGMLIKSAAIDVGGIGAEYDGLAVYLRELALAGDAIAILAAGALVAGLVSIMMSTTDTALIASTQIFFQNILGMQSIKKAQIYASYLLVTALIFGLAYFHVQKTTANILVVMAGVYSALVVLSPIVIALLLRRKLNQFVVAASIIFGILAAMIATFYPISGLHINIQLVLPILASVAISLTLIGINVLTNKLIGG